MDDPPAMASWYFATAGCIARMKDAGRLDGRREAQVSGQDPVVAQSSSTSKSSMNVVMMSSAQATEEPGATHSQVWEPCIIHLGAHMLAGTLESLLVKNAEMTNFVSSRRSYLSNELLLCVFPHPGQGTTSISIQRARNLNLWPFLREAGCIQLMCRHHDTITPVHTVAENRCADQMMDGVFLHLFARVSYTYFARDSALFKKIRPIRLRERLIWQISENETKWTVTHMRQFVHFPPV